MVGKTKTRNETPGPSAYLEMNRSGDAVFLNIAGDWIVGSRMPSPTEVEDEIGKGQAPGRVEFKTERLQRWDSALLAFLVDVAGIFRNKGIPVVMGGLSQGV